MGYDLDDLKDKKSDAERKLEEEEKEIKEDNLKSAKAARMKLEGAHLKQKAITDEIKRQNEKLEVARQAGFNVYDQGNEAGRKAIDLEKNSNPLDFLAGAKGKYSKWSNEDQNERAEIENMKKTKEEHVEAGANPSLHSGGNDSETTEELKKILLNTKNIARETEAQSMEGKKQETKLNQIYTTGKYAEENVKKTDERLKKDL